jgi:hypothetical protein
MQKYISDLWLIALLILITTTASGQNNTQQQNAQGNTTQNSNMPQNSQTGSMTNSQTEQNQQIPAQQPYNQTANQNTTQPIQNTTNTDSSQQSSAPLSSEEKKEQLKTVWLDIGARLSIGGNYLTIPDGADPWGSYSTAPFEDGAGGVGAGGGIFFEVRFLNGHLGLETGFIFERNRDWCAIQIDGWDDHYYTYKFGNLRIPLFIKAIFTKGSPRFGIGIGPEFAIGFSSVNTDVRTDSGGSYEFEGIEQNDVFMAMDFSWAIERKPWIIALDLKFAYNMTQPKKYWDRVDNPSSHDFSTVASHTLDGRFLFGVAYEFEFKSRNNKSSAPQ